jgi:uncharacterized glyoxalase superfamily protein PhnB
MSNGPKATRSTIIVALRYQNADAAVAWLVRAFGFVPHIVYTCAAGTVEHAELSFGNGMIMLGPDTDNAFGKLMVMPAAIGRRSTQAVYAIVEDADAHHATAVAAGAEIVQALYDPPYGGREYACRDLEGHLWSFGQYDPWAAKNPASG